MPVRIQPRRDSNLTHINLSSPQDRLGAKKVDLEREFDVRLSFCGKLVQEKPKYKKNLCVDIEGSQSSYRAVVAEMETLILCGHPLDAQRVLMYDLARENPEIFLESSGCLVRQRYPVTDDPVSFGPKKWMGILRLPKSNDPSISVRGAFIGPRGKGLKEVSDDRRLNCEVRVTEEPQLLVHVAGDKLSCARECMERANKRNEWVIANFKNIEPATDIKKVRKRGSRKNSS